MLSVKRSFRLKNTGLTPIWFAGFEVEGVPCEGYGFKVLNCEGFNLEPSATKDIDIATASSYATNDGKDAAFTNVPPSTFRVMSIHDDGNGSSDSCSSTSGTLHAVNGFSDDFESKFDVALHQDTKGFILEPGRRAKVRIRFAPETVYNDFRQCKCE